MIGAGTIGASWAAYFLARGMDVQVWDPAPDSDARVRAFVDDAWPALERLGLATTADRERLNVHTDLEVALQGAQFVQESAPERKPIKLELYEQFDRLLPPDIVMATSSSGLLLSELQANRVGRERYVLGHPFNPPHLIPLVEVLGGTDTDPAAVDWALAFYNTHGKKAVRLNKEVPGHLVNRLQAAIWRECFHAVVSGLASAEDVDTAIAYGPGLRWAVMGPHQLCQLAGGPGGMPDFIDHFGPPIEDWWADLRNVTFSEDVKAALIKGVEAANHGLSVAEVAQQRDRLLLEVLEALARARQK
jgi:3-hydroxyacyl-CoA dehydrogenase